jgi:[ribosomal protein S18]-alanine N-acetyltransferase
MSDSSLPSVSIRPVTPDDLEGILAIENRAYPIPWTREHFQDEWLKPYSTTWVLTDDETDSRIYGYAVFWTIDESIEILNIAVDLESRGLGWAKLMLQKVIREGLAKGAKRLILDVRKSNLPAFGLYQRAGFSITQIRKGFYTNGEDAYHMTLALDGASTDF